MANMRSTKIENAGHQLGRAQTVRSNVIIEPSYNYINMVSMNSGMGRLSAELSYTQAVANMEMRQGYDALDMANVQLKDAYEEAAYAEKETSRVLQENTKETRNRLSILEQQRNYFNGITTTNILSGYNEKIFEKRQQDLNEVPSGEGHMDRMLKFHDELVSGYLTASLDPDIKERLIPSFADYGRRLANQSFEAEQTRLVAKAELDLENAMSRATLHIANGMNPEDAVKELDPVMETIPDSMPWKTKAFQKSRQQLIQYSLLRTAALNPALAEQNLKGRKGIYSEISAEGVVRVENAIKAAYKEIEHKRSIENQQRIAFGISAHSDFLSQCETKIDTGNFGLSELEAAKAGLNKEEYHYLLQKIVKRRQAEEIANTKQIALETMAAKTGSYSFATPSEQKQIWFRKVTTEQWKDENGNPADNTNIMQSMAREADKFSTVLPLYKKTLKNKIMNGTGDEVLDAIAAFNLTYQNNRVVLGTETDTEIQQMEMVSSCLVDGYSIKDAREKAKQITSYIPREEKMELRREVLYDTDTETGLYSDLKAKDEDLATTYKSDAEFRRQFDKIYARNYVIARGDKKLGLDMSVNEANASYKTSSVNGPMLEDIPMWGVPEAYLSGKSLDEDYLRISFCNKAIEKSLNSDFTLESPKRGKANMCTFKNGDRGEYYFVPIPGEIGKYFVKAARIKEHWFSSPDLDKAGDEYICDNSGPVPKRIEISIDEIFDIGEY